MKRYFVLVSILSLVVTFGCGGGDGAPPPPSWTGTRQLGTSADDYAHGVAVDGSGNVYVTGSTAGSLDGNINAGSTDLFLVKYDSSGNRLWTQQLGTATGDSAYGVAVDGSGNAYVTGYTSGDLGNTNVGSGDLFLVKYDPSGNRLWTRQLGTTADDSAYGVAVDSSGNAYVTGYTAGVFDGNTNAGGDDLFLVKYNSSGNRLWTRQLGTPDDDSANGLAVDGNGNVYVTGDTWGGFDIYNNAGFTDLFLVKFDPSGNRRWTRQFGTTVWDLANGVAVDESGNAYVTGYTGGSLDGNISAGGHDLFLVKYDPSGNRLWTTQHGTTVDDPAYGVAVDTSGNAYVTGHTYGGLDGNSAGGRDLFLVKYDSLGAKVWMKQLGTATDDGALGVAVDTSGNAFVTGYTDGGLDGNTNAGGFDAFVVTYSSNGVKR